jgi:integrase
MPRKRTTDLGLPPRVYRKDSGAYSYHPPSGGSRKIAGKKATMTEVWEAYNHLVKSADFASLEYFAERYYQSNNFLTLEPRTQKDYRECSVRPVKAFEGFNCHKMTPAKITEYLDRRWLTTQRRTNYELTWFKNVFKNACRVGLFTSTNPTADLTPYRLSRAEKRANKDKYRYVSDDDYKAMYDAVPITGKVAMEIAYCTGIRPGDVLSMHKDDISENFAEIDENKTEQVYDKEITDRFQKALELSKSLPGQPFGGWIVRNRYGNQYTGSGWDSNWYKWKKRLPKHQQFEFKEIRHKAITDADGDKQRFSMHKDKRMLAIYDHKKPSSPSHN